MVQRIKEREKLIRKKEVSSRRNMNRRKYKWMNGEYKGIAKNKGGKGKREKELYTRKYEWKNLIKMGEWGRYRNSRE